MKLQALLNSILACCVVHGTETTNDGAEATDDHGPWTIQLQNSNFEPPIDKEEYFCKELMDVCAIKNCQHYIQHIKTIPSQRLYTDSGQPSKNNLRIPIDNWDHNKDVLLCVDSNYFKVKVPMSGIIRASNTLDIVELIPKESGSELTWTVNKLTQSPHPDEKPCEYLKFLINKQGTVSESVFKTDIGYKKTLPFLKTDPNKSQQFHHLSDCGDGGDVYDPETHNLMNCDKILCMNNMEPDTSIPQEAIIQCGISYRLQQVFYHASEEGGRWCKSKYPNDMETESQSLYDTLIKQGSDKEDATKILNSYDPQVRAYPYWGDVEKEIYKIPQYREFKDKGLLNFKEDPKPFGKLQGELKSVYSAIRKCKFIDADPKKNCQSKTVTPWDIMQNMVDLGYVKTGKANTANGEEAQNTNAAKQGKGADKTEKKEGEKSKEEKEELESGTRANRQTAAFLIMIMSTIIAMLLSFFIYIAH